MTKKLEIYITQNKKVLEKHIEYEITTLSSLSILNKAYTVVSRRYSQFEKLNSRLKKIQSKQRKQGMKENEILVLPSFPPKTYLWSNQSDVIDNRLVMFNNYCRFLAEYLIKCENLEWASEFAAFLENNEY